MRRLRESLSKHLPIWLIGGALILGTAYYVQVDRIEDRNRCQAKYNQAFAANIIVRAKLADELNKLNDQQEDATKSLLSGVSALIIQAAALEPNDEDSPEAKRLQKQYVDLFKAYDTNVQAIKKTEVEVQKTRSENPPPAIPNC